uniref:Uncharacterized protein n=1 Tax=Timema douglasi TaxID=61478 RepID=A0A7R8VT74_TIMDO|nr:unnamed protein product [Timema douglasi]
MADTLWTIIARYKPPTGSPRVSGYTGTSPEFPAVKYQPKFPVSCVLPLMGNIARITSSDLWIHHEERTNEMWLLGVDANIGGKMCPDTSSSLYITSVMGSGGASCPGQKES